MYVRGRGRERGFTSISVKSVNSYLHSIKLNSFASLGVLGLQGVFCAIWLIAAIGAATNESDSNIISNGQSFPYSSCSTYYYSKVRKYCNELLPSDSFGDDHV